MFVKTFTVIANASLTFQNEYKKSKLGEKELKQENLQLRDNIKVGVRWSGPFFASLEHSLKSFGV